MKLAIAAENGNVFQHLGSTPEFVIFDIQNNMIAGEEVLSSNGVTHCALIDLLAEQGVNELIVGGMGAHAVEKCDALNIKAHLGVTGDVRFAVKQYIEGDLVANGSICSGEHSHEHGADHQCNHQH